MSPAFRRVIGTVVIVAGFTVFVFLIPDHLVRSTAILFAFIFTLLLGILLVTVP